MISLRSIPFSPAVSVVLAIVAFFSCAIEMLGAQEQVPPGEESSSAKIPSALRGWLLPGNEQTNLVLRLRSAAGETSTISLASSQGGSPSLAEFFNAVPSGVYVCELMSGESVLLSKQVRLGAGKSMTLICLPGGDGKFELRLFDDGPLPLPPAERALRVLNFADGRETSLEMEGRGAIAIPADSVTETKLPPGQIPVNVSVQAKDGGYPAQSFIVVDLAESVSSYLAILPDAKGRLTPRALPGAPPPPTTSPIPMEPIVEVTPQQLRSQRIGRLELELDSKLARLAVLEASGKGPNKAENSAALKQVLEQKVAELQMEISRVRASNKAAEAAPVPANSAQRPTN